MNPALKLSDELAADIRARVKALDFSTIEKLAKAKEQNGTFDVIISTEDIDRSGEIVRQNGWDFTNYKNNPIVLWGHDYYSLPIGVCTETYETEVHGVPATGAKGVFFSADINPLAQQVRKMYDLGVKSGYNVGCTTSVGFIPKDFEPDNRNVITKAELLEFSFVPVPANQGVGPAQGRALTFAEAKELQLDVEALRVKGLEFIEKIEGEEVEVKAAEAGDSCEMEDGSLGVLAPDPNDPDGPLVCTPAETKVADKGPEKALKKALADEHDRHMGEMEKAVDEFRDKAYTAVGDRGDVGGPDGDEGKKAAKMPTAESQMREHLKDLHDAVRDEQSMHRAKSIACLRSFSPEMDKAFDKKEHLKALRDEHDAYEAKHKAALDELDERMVKSVEGGPDAVDEHTDWITGLIDTAGRAHKKAVTKIAKAMVKDAFGEEDQADEKTVAILKDFLTPHVDPLVLTALTLKIGARISSDTKKRIAEAHSHLNAAKAVLEALHPDLADGSGEESRSDEDGKSAPAPATPRSRTRTPSHDDEELKAHLLVRDTVRGIESAAREALGKINADLRSRSRK